jgi:UDP-glucose 4-epimerase
MLNLVLGGCGFIGTNLVQNLLESGQKVVSIDDLSNGVSRSSSNYDQDYFFSKLDISNRNGFKNVRTMLKNEKKEVRIWHLAANSDISKGSQDLFVDFENTLGTTVTALALTNELNVKEFIFASSSAVYGERFDHPMKEEMEMICPASVYGIAKLTAEMLISNKLRERPIKVRIYRFPNVIGLPMTHGVFRDFYEKLKEKPKFLHVLGNGQQIKPFLHVKDLINSMQILNKAEGSFEVFNIGPNDKGIEISKIAELMVREFSPTTNIKYGDTPFGWKGDVPRYSFDLSKAIENGLNPLLSSEESITKLIEELHLNG